MAEFVSEDEERVLLAFLDAMEFRQVEMRGQVARRTVRHFGLDYDYETYTVQPGDPLPAELEWVRERAAAAVEAAPEELAQILVTRYPPGAPIGWHRDAPMFGKVLGVSLAAASRMRFQRGKGAERETAGADAVAALDPAREGPAVFDHVPNAAAAAVATAARASTRRPTPSRPSMRRRPPAASPGRAGAGR